MNIPKPRWDCDCSTTFDSLAEAQRHLVSNPTHVVTEKLAGGSA